MPFALVAVPASVVLSLGLVDQDGALNAFRQLNPEARIYASSGIVTTIAGPAFGAGATPEQAAAQFIAAHAEVLGVVPADLVPGSLAGDDAAVRPINFVDGVARHTIVAYRQERAGVPVFRADVRLLVLNRADLGYPLTLVASGLRPLGDFAPNAAAMGAPATAQAHAAARAGIPGLKNGEFGAARLVIWAGTEEEAAKARLALEFEGVFGAPGQPFYQKWLILADAATGELLWKENQVVNVDVTGHVQGMATTGYKSASCNPEAMVPLPYLRMTMGATTVYADANGDYVMPNAGTAPVTITAGVRGHWFRVYSPSADAPTQSMTVTPPGPANFTFNADNTSDARRSEVNAYVQINRVRDQALFWAPTFPVIGTQTEFRINVNASPGTGFYDNTSVNLGMQGSGYDSFAFHDIAQHEYGHHLVAKAGSGQGPYGEGFGDLVGNLNSDQPVNGLGWQMNCTSGARTAQNTINYPCSNGDPHYCGQLLTGCFWETRNRLVTTNPSEYMDILHRLAFNSVLMHTGTTITPANVTEVCLALDDTDGNTANGTQHFGQIQRGFGQHLMAANIPFLDFIFPGGQPREMPAGQPYTVRIDILPHGAQPVEGTGQIFYRLGTTGAFTAAPLTVVGANQYAFDFPAAECGGTYSYYFSMTDNYGGTVNSPSTAPTAVYTLPVTSGRFADSFSDNGEGNPGWVLTGTAPGGQWAQATPVAGGSGEGTPTSDGDGSGACWVTGLANGADVDGGTAVLTSPPINATGLLATVSYWRWYYNSPVGINGSDAFIIQVSGNGTVWTTLEVVGPTGAQTHGGWVQKTFTIPAAAATSAFRIRFTATDSATDNPVEAAIDGVRINAVDCTPVCVTDFDGSGSVNSNDVSAFLDQWFVDQSAGTLVTDFDHSGEVNSNDVSAFLTAWFVDLNGC